MALTEVSYPVTGSVGTYKNTFPSNKPLYVEFSRKDIGISSISSGTDGVVAITGDASFTDIVVGEFVTWGSDGYSTRSSKILSWNGTDQIEVDNPFVSSNVTNGFVNFKQDYFLEIRYVSESSTSNDQEAIEIISDYTQAANNKEGEIKANILYPANLLNPNFELVSGTASGLSQSFKIQFRESWRGNRTNTWVSPTVDVPIMLVMGTKDFTVNQFTDQSLTTRYVRGYPLIHSLVYSNVNDSGSNDLKLNMSQYSLSKTFISETEIVSLSNFNGVYLFVVDTVALESNTTFIDFNYVLSTNNSQYESTQYDPAQYG